MCFAKIIFFSLAAVASAFTLPTWFIASRMKSSFDLYFIKALNYSSTPCDSSYTHLFTYRSREEALSESESQVLLRYSRILFVRLDFFELCSRRKWDKSREFPSRAQRKYFMEFLLRRNKEISLLSFKEFPQHRHECFCLHFKADSRERIIELGGEREACITADRSAGAKAIRRQRRQQKVWDYVKIFTF